MLRLLLTCLCIISSSLPLFSSDGMIHVDSHYNVTQTTDRLELILKQKGMTVFNRIKHSTSAEAVGVAVRPTELIIFGNPKVGSPLMHCQQTVGIDLPQKVLIWEDVKGSVQITYNDPAYLKQRHDIQGCDKVLAKVATVLAGITKAAASKK